MFRHLILWMHVVTPAGNVTDGAIVSMMPPEMCESTVIHASLKPNVVRGACTTGEDIDKALDAYGCKRIDSTNIAGLPASIYHCKELPTWK